MSKTLTNVRDTFPSVFEDFFKPWTEWLDDNGNHSRMLTIPAVNITEENDAYKATLAIPGMSKDDFNIDINSNILTISASREEKKDDQDKKYSRIEYNYSSFSRSFTLPDEVVQDKINAVYENGILTVTLPKTEGTGKKNKTIAVN